VAPLGELIEVKPPKREAQTRLNPDQPVSFVPMEDLKEIQRNFAPKQVRPLSEVYGGYTYFAEKDVLLAKITPCFENGKLSVARGLQNGVGFGSSEFMVLRCGTKLDPDYLFYFLSRDTFRETGKGSMTGAVGHKRVPPEFVQSQEIPLPPLDEQKRIVAVLDEAFEGLSRARANAEANLADARELFTVTLATLMTPHPSWTAVPLAQHVKFVVYRGKTPPKREQGVRLITAKNVKMGFVQRSPEEYVDPAAYDDWMTRGLPRHGDVLFTTEAPLANVAQLDTDEKVMIGQRLITMQPDPRIIDPTFLKFQLMSPQVQEAIRLKATGATVTGIKASLLKLVQIRFPANVTDQDEIAMKCEAAFEATKKVERQYASSIENLTSLRQAFLQKAFSGELT
jgi:type I restriction enzyme S subunit